MSEMKRGQIAIEVPSGRLITYTIPVPATKDALRASPWINVSWEGMPYPTAIRLALTEDAGDVVCTGVLLGPEDVEREPSSVRVTAGNLRQLPLNDILLGAQRLSRMSGQVGALPAEPDPDGLTWHEVLIGRRPPVSMADALLGSPRRRYHTPRMHPGRTGWPRQHFEAIAEAYNEIRARNPRSPMQELAEQQGYSLPQVRRWVQRAQEMGIPVNRPQRSGRRTVG